MATLRQQEVRSDHLHTPTLPHTCTQTECGEVCYSHNEVSRGEQCRLPSWSAVSRECRGLAGVSIVAGVRPPSGVSHVGRGSRGWNLRQHQGRKHLGFLITQMWRKGQGDRWDSIGVSAETLDVEPSLRKWKLGRGGRSQAAGQCWAADPWLSAGCKLCWQWPETRRGPGASADGALLLQVQGLPSGPTVTFQLLLPPAFRSPLQVKPARTLQQRGYLVPCRRLHGHSFLLLESRRASAAGTNIGHRCRTPCLCSPHGSHGSWAAPRPHHAWRAVVLPARLLSLLWGTCSSPTPATCLWRAGTQSFPLCLFCKGLFTILAINTCRCIPRNSTQVNKDGLLGQGWRKVGSESVGAGST